MRGRRRGPVAGPVLEGTYECKGRVGFVRPDEGDDDLFIRPPDSGGAMDGDRVRARVLVGRDGRTRGRVEEVLERGRETWVGTIAVRAGAAWLLPARGGAAISLPTRRALGAGRPGDRATVRIRRYPDRFSPAEGEVVEVLGRSGAAATEVEVARRLHGVPGAWPRPVLDEVERISDRVGAADLDDRADLRAEAICTIDPADARDHDDAISIEETTRGWRVGVHIADVSAYVPEGGAIDREAYARGTSTYLVDGVVPMLPERLSNGICSLVPDEDRLAVTVRVDVGRDGTVGATSFERSVIRSRRRFAYEEVDAILDDGRDDALAPALRAALACARALRARRIERGAIDLDLPEWKPILGPGGRVVEVRRVDRTWSHRLIEEFMILANEAVGSFLAERKVPVLYRVHPPPPPAKWDDLRAFLHPLGLRLRSGRDRDPRDLQAVLHAVEGRPEAAVVSMMVLRSMEEARYAPEDIGHFGLAARGYLHFTSPIRRYPDLIAHRALLRTLAGRPRRGRAAADGARLAEAGRHLSGRERAAAEAERDSVRVRLLEYAAGRLGEEVEGVVSGAIEKGLFVTTAFGADGLVRADSIGGDSWTFDEERACLRGRRTRARIGLGDPVVVVPVAVDLETRRLDLRLARLPDEK